MHCKDSESCTLNPASHPLAPWRQVVPVALRMPHRPLAAATLQCIASAALKPYPSVADVAQYLVRRP
jgi:GPI transamidase subunit PIG-U